MPGDQNGTSPASLKTTFSPDSIRRALLAAPEFMLRREVVTALRKIDNPRAVDFFHEQLEGLPCAEADRLAHTLAGTDLLNAAWSLARKARASGDLRTLAQAVFAARDAQDEHRLRLEPSGTAKARRMSAATTKAEARTPAGPPRKPARR